MLRNKESNKESNLPKMKKKSRNTKKVKSKKTCINPMRRELNGLVLNLETLTQVIEVDRIKEGDKIIGEVVAASSVEGAASSLKKIVNNKKKRAKSGILNKN